MASVTHHLGSLDGIAVLDLYAGSGALGLEAASRGAARVDLVERDRGAARVVSANAKKLGLSQAVVVVSPVLAHLRGAAPMAYDLVFLDPPYELPDAQLELVLRRLADPAAGWLARKALVVVERSTRNPLVWPSGLAGVAVRTYSQTAIWYGQPSADCEPKE